MNNSVSEQHSKHNLILLLEAQLLLVAGSSVARLNPATEAQLLALRQGRALLDLILPQDLPSLR